MTTAPGDLPLNIGSFSSPQPTPWAAIVPLVAILPAVLCMIDISRHPRTQQFPPQIWLVIRAFGNIFGLLAYLRFGRSEDR